MFKRPIVFAIVAAMMIPAIMLLILALNPMSPGFIASLRLVGDRVRERPVGLARVAGFMLFLGALGFVAGVYSSRRQRASRVAKGLCPICGYDLRASNEKCPECGTETAAQ